MKWTRYLAGVSLAAAVVPYGAAAQVYSFASLPQGTINYFQVSALAKVIQQTSGMRMRVTPLRGTHLTLAALNAGEAEFNLGGLPEIADAHDGRARFTGKPQSKLRVAFNLRPLTLGALVRKDSGITSLAQLKGKRLPTGWKAFPQTISYFNATLKTVGLSLNDGIPVPVSDLIRSGDDFKEGKIATTFFALQAPKVKEIDAAVGGIRFLSIPEGPQALATVQSFHPQYFIATVKPNPALVGLEGPTRVLAFDIVIGTSTNVSNEVVYRMVKAVHDNRDKLIKAHGSFRAFHPKSMAKPFKAIAYHPAAVKYYKEIGIWPEKN